MPQKNHQNYSYHLFRNLGLLTQAEIKSLKKWLKSPWCNSNKKLIKLYEILIPHYPDFNDKAIEKKRILKKLYPNTADDKQLRNLFSAFNKTISTFLVCQAVIQDETKKSEVLRQEYLNRSAIAPFSKISQELINTFEDQQSISPDHHLKLTTLNKDLYFNTYQSNTIEQSGDLLASANSHLDQFYLILKTQFLSEFFERKKLLGKEGFDDTYTKLDLQQLIQENQRHPIINFYWKRLELNGREVNLEAVKSLQIAFLEIKDKVSPKEKENMLLYLLNDLSRLFRTGHSKALPLIFELYKMGFEEGILHYKGQVADNIFQNVVTTGNSLGAFNYVTNFISTYKKYLPTQSKEEAIILANAQTDFYQGNFRACISGIKDYSFKIPFYKKRVRLLLTQAYFGELSNDFSQIRLLDSYCTSFLNQLRNKNELSRDKAFIEFVKYTLRLAKWYVKPFHKKEDLELLEKELLSNPNVQARNWLVDQIKNLKEEQFAPH